MSTSLLPLRLHRWVIRLRDHLWFKYVWKSAHGNHKGVIGIRDALTHFDDVRINGNERHHLKQAKEQNKVGRIRDWKNAVV